MTRFNNSGIVINEMTFGSLDNAIVYELLGKRVCPSTSHEFIRQLRIETKVAPCGAPANSFYYPERSRHMLGYCENFSLVYNLFVQDGRMALSPAFFGGEKTNCLYKIFSDNYPHREFMTVVAEALNAHITKSTLLSGFIREVKKLMYEWRQVYDDHGPVHRAFYTESKRIKQDGAPSRGHLNFMEKREETSPVEFGPSTHTSDYDDEFSYIGDLLDDEDTVLAATTFVKPPAPSGNKLPADAKTRSCIRFMRTGTCPFAKNGQKCAYSHDPIVNKFDAAVDIKDLTARYFPALAEAVGKLLNPPRHVASILRRDHEAPTSHPRTAAFGEFHDEDESLA
jgi:hypothetical protein